MKTLMIFIKHTILLLTGLSLYFTSAAQYPFIS